MEADVAGDEDEFAVDDTGVLRVPYQPPSKPEDEDEDDKEGLEMNGERELEGADDEDETNCCEGDVEEDNEVVWVMI